MGRRGLQHLLVGAAVGLSAGALGAVPASAATGRARIRVAAAAVREIPGSAHVGAPLAQTRRLALTIALQPRDPLALHAFATAVSTPRSAIRGDYLSVAQFAGRFGASPAAIARVHRALARDGFRVGAVSANELSMKVSATTAQVQRSFETTMAQVRLANGRRAYVNTTAATLPADLAADVQGVVGLDSAALPQAQLASRAHRRVMTRARSAAIQSPQDVTGGPQPCAVATETEEQEEFDGDPLPPNTADQIANAYDFSPFYTAGDFGQGATIALYEVGQPYPISDVAAYDACYTLGGATINPSVTLEPVDGGPGTYNPSSSDDGEVALDIDVIAGMAPRANILVYSAPQVATAAVDTLTAIVSQDAAKVVSISYGLCEASTPPSELAAENTLLQEAAAQGQTVLSASGDTGDETCSQSNAQNTTLSVSDPASQPFNTAVGGTTLDSDAAPATEQVWNDGPGSGSGGGLSQVWAMPSYQQTASPNLGVVDPYSIVPGISCASTYCREIPDVAADAAPESGYVVYSSNEGGWTVTGGTSGATPLWASLIALSDASATCRGLSIGFANPSLYGIASSAYLSNFYDIGPTPSPISGQANNDTTGGQNGLFPTTAGYDMTTGLGSPVAATLGTALCAARAPVYTVSVANPGAVRTIVGQPLAFAVHGADSGSVPISYSASGLPAGVAINPANGVISGTPTTLGAATVTVAAGDNDANSGSTQFVIDVVAPYRPQASGVRFTDLTRRRPALSFTLRSRSGTVHSLTVALPRGVSFSRRHRNLERGISIRDGRTRVRYTVRVRRGTLSLTPHTAHATLTVRIARPAFLITHNEVERIRRHHVTRLRVRIRAVNSLLATSNQRVTVRRLD